MSRWNRLLLCGALCAVLGFGLACKKDEEAEDYGDNAATDTGMMTTEEAPPTTEMMSTDMGTDMSTDMVPPAAAAPTPP